MMCDDKKKMTAKTLKTYAQELLAGSYAQMKQIDELTAERDALKARIEELEEGSWPFEWVVATREREQRQACERERNALHEENARLRATLEQIAHSAD